jgi:NinG protein
MQRTKLKRKSKQPISKIQRLLWEHCKRIIRAKYGNTCFTCNRTNLIGSNWHTGHLLAKASVGAYLKYDTRLLRPQCYFCNINLGGNGAIFIENLRRIEGNEYVDQILKDRQVTVKAYDFYLTLLAEYEKL